MTHPRLFQLGDQPLYKGGQAATRLEEHSVTFPSGCQVTASLYRVINAATHPELLGSLGDGSLNQVACPETGERMIADVPVVVHDPEFHLLFLVVPEGGRSRDIRCRMEMLAQLAEEEEEPPAYALNFVVEHLPFGPEDLDRYRRSIQLYRQLQDQALHLSYVADAQVVEEQRLRQWAEDLAGVERQLTGRHAMGEAGGLGGEEHQPPLAGLPMAPGVGDAPLDDQTPTVRSRSPYYPEQEEILELTSEEIELVEDVELESVDMPVEGGAKPDLDFEPGRTLASPHGGIASDQELLKEMPAVDVEPTATIDLSTILPGRGVGVLVGDKGVAIYFAVDHGRVKAFLQREPDILLQLHRLPGYPIVSVLLVAQDEAGALLDELICVFDIQGEQDRKILDRLLQKFRLEVHLYDEGAKRVQYLVYERPLEKNLAYILDRAGRWLAEVAPEERDFSRAAGLFTSDGFERIGAQKHGFTASSFAEINSATAARLAVSIVSYWSEAQNFEYLVENRSFPLDYIRQIQRRVIEGAQRFGVFLPYDLRVQAIETELAEDHASLLEQLLSRFTELMERRRSTDLDSVAEAENWDQLLTACTDLGLAVGEQTRELAEKARRRSRQLRSSPGISLTDLKETDEYQRISSITQASDEDLQELLGRGAMTPLVSRELLSRGGETNVLRVIESARFFSEEALEATARILAAGAEQFEPALLMGLGHEIPRTVHLCALAMALAGRAEALCTLFERIHEPRLTQEIPLKEIVALYGRQAIQPLFDAIEERGVTDPLVEVLALISVEQGAEIIAALRENPKPVLLDAAQKMTMVRRRLRERVIRSLSDEEESSDQDPGDEDPSDGEP
ncbi:MAG: hypothetical protein JW797_02775 [Bradymonadales bacterium]|nr:hypothetical protein [Bradymonadales bacterium]